MLGGAGELGGELGGEGEGGAVGDLEVVAERLAWAPWSPMIFGVDREGIAVGRVEGEVGAVEFDPDRAEAQGDAFEDLGQGVGDGGDLGGFGVDVEGGADDDVAEVIGAGDRGGDDGEGERGALVGAGEVDLARDVEGVGAGAGAGDRRCRSGRRRGSSDWPPLRGRSSWVRRPGRGRRRSSRGCP